MERLPACSEEETSSSQLWKQIDAIMTDAASKNLMIELVVAEKLGSQHIPHHLLCKIHTVEALDRSCLEICANI